VAGGAFASEPDKPYHIPWIEMSNEMHQSLDCEGNLDRNPENVEALIAHGEERGRTFLAEATTCRGRPGRFLDDELNHKPREARDAR
jgi:NTE family protein